MLEVDEEFEEAMVRALAQKSSFRVGTPLQTRDELWNFIASEYGFQIPRTPVCVDHCSPFDALADSYFDVAQDMIWIGPRTGGKTLQFAILDHLCMMHFGDTIANVGAIEEQALKCYEYFTRFCNLPQFRHLIKGQSLISKTSFHNGGKVEILPGTMRRVNSPHPRRAHWDEIELTEQRILDEGLSMPMRVNGRPPVTIYTSSRKKATGPMERMLRDANEKGFSVRKWCLAAGTEIDTLGGTKCVEDIRVGDIVWTYDGCSFHTQAVSWAGCTGTRSTVVVRLTDGHEITCTEDHEVLTARGWIAAGRLLSDVRHDEADLVAAVSYGPLCVRREEVSQIQDMRCVPYEALGDAKQERENAESIGARTEASSEHAFSGGETSLAIAGYSWPVLSAAGADRNAHGGLSRGGNGNRSAWVASRESRSDVQRQDTSCTPAGAWLSYGDPVGGRDGVLGIDAPRGVRVASVSPGPTVEVYDLTVPGTHNFIANGLIVHNCVFEIIEQCPPTRHQDGVGCNTCPIEEICRETTYDEHGNEVVSQVGRAARANGWMLIDDVSSKYRSLDSDVFNAQWLSKKPQTRGLAYPMWDEDIHVIDYTWNRGLPVVSGIDFGFTNPSVALYLQPLPNDDIVVFAEDYRAGRTADEFAMSILGEPWFHSTIWRSADPADAGDRQTLQNHGVKNEAADKACTAEEPSSVVAGINLVRWLLRPKGRKRPILYVAKQCVNLRDEIAEYHHPEETETRAMNERPTKKNDHACDALRYACRRLFRGGLAV